MKFKIAVVQFKIDQNNPENNLIHAEKFIKKAAELKAGIIVFPEYFIDGTREADFDSFNSGDKYKIYFQNLAKKYKIDIVAGSVVEKKDQKLYNTSYYINDQGKILGKYRKINLWHTEKSSVAPGTEIAVFDTRFGKVGLIICWDLFFPGIFTEMARAGVETVFCPSYWRYEDAGIGIKYDKNSEIKLIDSICTARAFENEIIFVYSSAASRQKTEGTVDTLAGHSQIAVPFRGCIKKMNNNKEGMFVQEVNTDILNDAEKVYKIREYLKNK